VGSIPIARSTSALQKTLVPSRKPDYTSKVVSFSLPHALIDFLVLGRPFTESHP
jgi:hypothetical protein